jgi:hypothetical protein
MACINYITETKLFAANGQTDSQCNTILFINTGTDAVSIDGLILQTNQSWEVVGNVGEMNIKTYNFLFSTTVSPQLTIIFKRYV